MKGLALLMRYTIELYSPLYNRGGVSGGFDVDITAVTFGEFLHLLYHITLGWIDRHISPTLFGYLQLNGQQRYVIKFGGLAASKSMLNASNKQMINLVSTKSTSPFGSI